MAFSTRRFFSFIYYQPFSKILSLILFYAYSAHYIAKLQVQYICNVFYMFSATVQLLQVQIVVAQADLAAMIIAVDLIVSLCTTHMFLRSKESVGTPVVAEEGEESQDLVCKTQGSDEGL